MLSLPWKPLPGWEQSLSPPPVPPRPRSQSISPFLSLFSRGIFHPSLARLRLPGIWGSSSPPARGEGGKGQHKNTLKCVPRARVALLPILHLSKRGGKAGGCGKSQAGSLRDPQAPDPFPGWIGVTPCFGEQLPRLGTAPDPQNPCLTLGFPTSSQENPDQHPAAALPRPSTNALVNSLFSLNYTKAMIVLSSLYNASA